MNGGKTGNERREWARLPLAIPVFVRSRDGKGKEFLEFATALNVSAGGMLVAIRRILPAVAQIQLEIPSAPVAALALITKRFADSSSESTSNHASRRLLLARPQICASVAGSQQPSKNCDCSVKMFAHLP